MQTDSWKTYKFSELLQIPLKNGLTKPSRIRGEGVKMVNMGELFAHNRLLNVPMERVPLSIKEGESNLLEIGDLLFARQSLVVSGAGKCSIFLGDDENVTFEGHLIRARVNKEIANSLFLYYFFQSPIGRNKVESLVEVTAAAGIRGSDLARLMVDLPTLEEQIIIARILNTLDNKIELNRRMNKTLEATARALFKAWFVDFEPVRANMENRPAESASPEIAKLFPSEFENGIPKGWEEKDFGELLQLTIGGDWGTDEETEKNTNKVAIVRGTDIPSIKNGNFETAPLRFVQTNKLEKRELQDGDIIIEVSGGSRDQATGRCLYFTDALLQNFQHKAVPASFCRLFRGINAEVSLLLSIHLQDLYDIGGTWQYQTQSTGISNFQTTHFLNSEKIVLPVNSVILKEFYKIVRPIIEKQQSGESAKLARIRDSLLPRLISGKIPVRKIESEAEGEMNETVKRLGRQHL
jgi:type I restriction enzyme S subunit